MLFGGVIGVFIVCMIIDLIVQKLLINNLLKLLSKIYRILINSKLYVKAKNKIIDFYNN